MIPTPETITVSRSGGLDDWGRPLPSITESFRCRIDYKNDVVKDENGNDVVSRATILVKGAAKISTEDTVSWSDQFGDHKGKPISVSPVKDFSARVLFTKVVM